MAKKKAAPASDVSLARLIADGELAQVVDLRTLIEHPKNVNEADNGEVYESLKAHGFYGTIIVQTATRRVLAGHARRRNWIQLSIDGQVHPDVAFRAPVQFVDVDDDEALRILLADNRTGRLGHDNLGDLADVLQELAASDRGLAGTGYDGDALDQILAELNPPPKEKASGQDGLADEPDEATKQPDDATQFLLVIDCKDEPTLQALYEELAERQFECRMVT